MDPQKLDLSGHVSAAEASGCFHFACLSLPVSRWEKGKKCNLRVKNWMSAWLCVDLNVMFVHLGGVH